MTTIWNSLVQRTGGSQTITPIETEHTPDQQGFQRGMTASSIPIPNEPRAHRLDGAESASAVTGTMGTPSIAEEM